MRAAVISPWALSLLLASCAGAPAPMPVDPQPPPDADPASRPEAAAPDADTEPSAEDALLDIVRGNIATTELSAVVEVTGARVEGPNGGPAPTAGYVNHVYTVKILTPISGCGGQTGFTFAEMAEADIKPKAVGTVLVVSVCRGATGSYHTPDVAYAIPQSELPAPALAELAANPPAKAETVCGE